MTHIYLYWFSNTVQGLDFHKPTVTPQEMSSGTRDEFLFFFFFLVRSEVSNSFSTYLALWYMKQVIYLPFLSMKIKVELRHVCHDTSRTWFFWGGNDRAWVRRNYALALDRKTFSKWKEEEQPGNTEQYSESELIVHQEEIIDGGNPMVCGEPMKVVSSSAYNRRSYVFSAAMGKIDFSKVSQWFIVQTKQTAPLSNSSIRADATHVSLQGASLLILKLCCNLSWKGQAEPFSKA